MLQPWLKCVVLCAGWWQGSTEIDAAKPPERGRVEEDYG